MANADSYVEDSNGFVIGTESGGICGTSDPCLIRAMRGESETGRSVNVSAFFGVPIPGKNEKLKNIKILKNVYFEIAELEGILLDGREKL